MRKNKLLLLLALLLTAATGAWATDVYVVGNGSDGNWLNGVAWDPGVADNKMTEQNGVYSITYKDVDANSELLFKFAINGSWTENFGCTSWDANELNKTLSNIEANGANFKFGLTEKADVTISFNLSEMTYMISTKGMKVGDDAATTYTVSLKDNVKDADKWTVKVGDGQAQALPIGGLKGDGSETVTLQYTGRLKVKGVKATSDEAAKPAAEGHALSASAVGEIVGTDGKAYAAADKDNLPKGVKAEALVCYVDGDHGLALAMADVKDAKMSWDNNRGANDGKTAAEWCTGWNTSHPITGATWLLASKTQWNNMISAAGGASNLSNAFSAVGGTNLQAFSYWSSTPNIGTSAWRYYFPSSSWSWTYLNQDNTGSFIRACLEW